MKKLLTLMTFALICALGMAQNTKTGQKTAAKKTVVVKQQDQKKTDKGIDTVTQSAPKAKAEEQTASTHITGYLCNQPLPYMPPKLDILFIGNSFSIDTSTALPEIFKTMGIDNVNVYVLFKPGCSMKEHYTYYKNDEKIYELYHYNSKEGKLVEKQYTIRAAMEREYWDIVIFQQYSLESGDYTSYEPYLSKIIQAYKLSSRGSRTTFAFNQTWAYSSQHKNITRYKTPLNMYAKICESVQKMKQASGIDVIIPCGTAVQNARAVPSLATSRELTRDNQHIDSYMGRYLLSATFFEAIIAPCLGRSILDDYTTYGQPNTPNQVNDSNRRKLQDCARLAVANNYSVSEFVPQ